MNTKGFTLMEILAVLLVIAVIASFAVPLIQSVRRDVRLQKAKAAGIELAEAVRSFYTDTKGCLATTDDNSFQGAQTAPAEVGACPATHPIKTGIPPGNGICSETNARIVFACDYISSKMFVDLPYEFKIYDPRAEASSQLDSEGNKVYKFITGKESVSAAEKPRCFTVFRDMQVKDGEYDDTNERCVYDED